MKKFIKIDVERCMSCLSCRVACAVEHSETKRLESALLESPKPKARLFLREFKGSKVPLQCKQCVNAPCIKVCPTEAIKRDNNIVIVDQAECNGCKKCEEACPFGVIKYDVETSTLLKCDLCTKRVDVGGRPACVEGCPTGALEFVKTEDR